MSASKIVSTYKRLTNDGRFTKKDAEEVIRTAGKRVDAKEIAALAAIASADGFDVGSLGLQDLYGLPSAVGDQKVTGAGHWAVHRFVQQKKSSLHELKKPDVEKSLRTHGFAPATASLLGQWGANVGGTKTSGDGTDLSALVQISGERRDSDVVEVGGLIMTADYPPHPPTSDESVDALGGRFRVRRYVAVQGYADFRIMRREDLPRLLNDVEAGLAANRPSDTQVLAPDANNVARHPPGAFSFDEAKIKRELRRRDYEPFDERGPNGEIVASRPGGHHGGPKDVLVRVYPDGAISVESRFHLERGRSEVAEAAGYPGEIVVNEHPTVRVDGFAGGAPLDKLLGALWDTLRARR